MATLRWAVVEPVVEQLQPHRILEVGCGQGGIGARLAGRAEYLGLEPDHASYAIARSRIEPLGGQVLNTTTDTLDPGERFDLICAFEVIEHLEDDVGSLSSWLQRLNPGGSLLVSVPAWPDRFGPCDELAGHFRRYTPEQLETTLRQAGCATARHVVYAWPLGYALEFGRNQIARRRARQSGPNSLSERTAASGRLWQPNSTMGVVVRVGTAPFRFAQQLRPEVGNALVGVGTLEGIHS